VSDEEDFEKGAASSSFNQAMDSALFALRLGNLDGAVLHLRRLLGSDPSDAEGHALLARVLVMQKRLVAAEHEARAALGIDPELINGHLAMAYVQLANRTLRDAAKTFERVLELDPESTAAVMGLAQLARLQGRHDDERRELERAVKLDLEDEAPLVALGHWHLLAGELEQAGRYAQRARDLVEDDLEVLVLVGHLELRRGNIEAAKDHALWALQQGPMNELALSLMASIQARQSLLLGLWWRFSVWLQARGDKGQIAILITGWLLFTVARLVSGDLGTPTLAMVFEYVWLGICVYSWVGPALFARAVEKELEQVRLRGDF
jgi:tetratricopeptide (TPR) repeat protein